MTGSIAAHTQYGERESRVDSLRLADLAGLHGAEQGKEFVELHLRDAHVVEEILREGCRMLRDLDQPRQNGIGIDLEDPGDGADAQAFRQRAHRPPQLVGRDAFAMATACRGSLGNSPRKPCSSIAARGHHSDGRWR